MRGPSGCARSIPETPVPRTVRQPTRDFERRDSGDRAPVRRGAADRGPTGRTRDSGSWCDIPTTRSAFSEDRPLDEVAEEVFDSEMRLLDMLRIGVGNTDGDISQIPQLAATASENDRHNAGGMRCLDRANDIWRIAARADPQDD